MRGYRYFLQDLLSVCLEVTRVMENDQWHHETDTERSRAYMSLNALMQDAYERGEQYAYAKSRRKTPTVPVPRHVQQAKDNVGGQLAERYADRGRAIRDQFARRLAELPGAGDDVDEADPESDGAAGGDVDRDGE